MHTPNAHTHTAHAPRMKLKVSRARSLYHLLHRFLEDLLSKSSSSSSSSSPPLLLLHHYHHNTGLIHRNSLKAIRGTPPICIQLQLNGVSPSVGNRVLTASAPTVWINSNCFPLGVSNVYRTLQTVGGPYGKENVYTLSTKTGAGGLCKWCTLECLVQSVSWWRTRLVQRGCLGTW